MNKVIQRHRIKCTKKNNKEKTSERPEGIERERERERQLEGEREGERGLGTQTENA